MILNKVALILMQVLLASNECDDISIFAIVPFTNSEPGKLYRHILRFMPWPHVERNKKHGAKGHCGNVPLGITSFRRSWNGVSGIYKITFLPFRIFTYYGSSVDLSMRFKYHYFFLLLRRRRRTGSKQGNFLGMFLSVFGWENFSITVVETCSKDVLHARENWYLNKYKPLLNVLTSTTENPRSTNILSALTRAKISASLTGRVESELTRAKKSLAQKGANNPFYGKGPGIKALDAAAELAGSKVYVYDATNFKAVEGSPFRSIRMTAKHMPISPSSLPIKLDTGKPFKGYYYYSTPQTGLSK